MNLLFLIFFFPIFPTSQAFVHSNSSILPAFSASNTPPPPPSVPSSPPSRSFLKEVLSAIAAKEQWDPESEARVSVVETESARVNAIESFEFHVRVGRATLLLKFSEEVDEWRKAEEEEVEFGPDLVALHEGFRQGIRVLKLEGPVEFHASGEDELSVHLPSLNVTHHGLKRVLVGEGISIEVHSSEEISIFFPHDTAFALKKSSSNREQPRDQFWPLGLSICAPLVTIRVAGPASLVAFRDTDAESHIKTSFLSHNTIQLLPEKCYRNIPYSASQTFASKIAVVERLLSSVLGKSALLARSSRLVRMKVASTTLLRLRVEVERNITENDRKWKRAAKWRTRPTVERFWFEVVGRLEGGRGLVPVIARRLPRPLMMVESAAWSHLMSNMSFAEFPSIVVPPEALTLDIKW